MRSLVAALVVGAAALTACGDSATPTPSVPVPATATPIALTVVSAAFDDGAAIPAEYTCEGRDASPPLTWTEVRGAGSWAVVMEDIDAGFTHWVRWALPADTMAVGTGQPPTEPARDGRNSFGRDGYGGPCPPRGDAEHRYVFTVYALAVPIGLAAGATVAEVLDAIEHGSLAEARLTGTYRR